MHGPQTPRREVQSLDVWEGPIVRPAYSKGETARLSGQMSIIVGIV